MPEIREDFPLFPLGMVALPGELVPLHIFEERYKTMIGHCLDTETEFGIVWLSDSELREVGCACEIAEVLARQEDGRMNILTRGTRPLRVLRRQEELAYPAGEVEFLEDADEPPDPEARQTAHEVYAELVKEATDQAPEAETLAEMTAYDMAATVDFGPEPKQDLLELRVETERLVLLTEMLRAAAKRLEMAERAQARARSNGKVRFG